MGWDYLDCQFTTHVYKVSSLWRIWWPLKRPNFRIIR